jgi:uncharacterized protein (TIGR00730 family)
MGDMKNICVFCSASVVDTRYIDDATKLGSLMATHGYSLVWGGSDTGLMKVIADSVQKNGGKIFGVSVEFLKDKARKNADEMVMTKDLSERKHMLLKRADAIVLLTGGLGSLDEIAEILEFKKQKMHDKPVVVLNTDNFYEGLKMQLDRMYSEKFINRPIDELVHFVNTPEEAINYIDSTL